MFSTLRPFIGARVTTQIRSVSLLSQLHPAKGSIKTEKRVGRGPGSGLGKTSGRGQKGQKARESIPNWFEGGQTPLYRLIPKRGFYRQNKKDLNEIKLSKIQEFYDEGRIQLKEGETLTMAKMKQFGLVSGRMKDGVTLLGTGKETYNVPIKVEATKATSHAIKAIEKAGGEFTSRYFSRLSYRAHHASNWFLANRGYIPLASRPIARRDVLFYNSSEKRGYLYKQKLAEGEADKLDVKPVIKKQIKQDNKSPLELQLEKATKAGPVSFDYLEENKIVSFKDLNK